MQSESGKTRDLELGRALKNALGGDDIAGLEARLLDAFDREFGESSEDTWSILTAWAWPGVAVAAAVLLIALATSRDFS